MGGIKDVYSRSHLVLLNSIKRLFVGNNVNSEVYDELYVEQFIIAGLCIRIHYVTILRKRFQLITCYNYNFKLSTQSGNIEISTSRWYVQY